MNVGIIEDRVACELRESTSPGPWRSQTAVRGETVQGELNVSGVWRPRVFALAPVMRDLIWYVLYDSLVAVKVSIRTRVNEA